MTGNIGVMNADGCPCLQAHMHIFKPAPTDQMFIHIPASMHSCVLTYTNVHHRQGMWRNTIWQARNPTEA